MSGLYLSIGGNQGDRLAFLKSARQAISSEIGPVLKRSSVYETKAWGNESQGDFLNQVLKVSSQLSPQDCMTRILEIEKRLGRIREKKWAARCIDIDILYYAYKKKKGKKLTIPHPYIQDRMFILIPLVEIAPGFVHPIFRKTNTTLLKECADPLAVEIYKS